LFGPKTASGWGAGISLVGPQGPIGLTGPAGAQGIQGIQGPQGISGTDGKTVLNGTSDPTTQGTEGDFFINTTSNTLFGPKTASGWGTGISLVGPQGPIGPAGFLTTGASSGNTPYWSGSNWVVDNSNVFNNGGNVGIGTITPASKFEVNGAATNTSAFDAGSATTINFDLSNLAYTSSTSTSIILQNIKDGGAYTLVFTSTSASGTVNFSATGFSFVQMGTTDRTSGKRHIYNFVVVDTEVYVTMAREN